MGAENGKLAVENTGLVLDWFDWMYLIHWSWRSIEGGIFMIIYVYLILGNGLALVVDKLSCVSNAKLSRPLLPDMKGAQHWVFSLCQSQNQNHQIISNNISIYARINVYVICINVYVYNIYVCVCLRVPFCSHMFQVRSTVQIRSGWKGACKEGALQQGHRQCLALRAPAESTGNAPRMRSWGHPSEVGEEVASSAGAWMAQLIPVDHSQGCHDCATARFLDSKCVWKFGSWNG
jgi:hypothetical protein